MTVFGYYKIISIERNDNEEFPFNLKCINPSYPDNEARIISSKSSYPINTIIEWEYNYKTDKGSLRIVKLG